MANISHWRHHIRPHSDLSWRTERPGHAGVLFIQPPFSASTCWLSEKQQPLEEGSWAHQFDFPFGSEGSNLPLLKLLFPLSSSSFFFNTLFQCLCLLTIYPKATWIKMNDFWFCQQLRISTRMRYKQIKTQREQGNERLRMKVFISHYSFR